MNRSSTTHGFHHHRYGFLIFVVLQATTASFFMSTVIAGYRTTPEQQANKKKPLVVTKTKTGGGKKFFQEPVSIKLKGGYNHHWDTHNIKPDMILYNDNSNNNNNENKKQSHVVVDDNYYVNVGDDDDDDDKRLLMGIIPRPYTWPIGKDIPCDFNTTKRQIVFVKPMKAGSSTAASINIRIARNVAQRRRKKKKKNTIIGRRQFDDDDDDVVDDNSCTTSYKHGIARDKMKHIDIENHFLWSILREPTSRLISYFFFFLVSRDGIEPTDEHIISFLKKKKNDMYYYKLLSTIGYVPNIDNPIDIANKIFNDYNFIAITERMDESIVTMMMLFNLEMSDVIHLDSKIHGGYDDGASKHGCVQIQSSFISPTVQTYIDSSDWKESSMMKYEYAIYHAANRSLDRTIEQFDRNEFETNLYNYRTISNIVRTTCIPPLIIFPCDSSGNKISNNITNCIYHDLGCGMECIDQATQENK